MSDPHQPYGAVPPGFPPPPGGPPSGPPSGPPGTPPYGTPVGPGGPDDPGTGKGRGLWIGLGIVGVLALVGVVVGLVLLLTGGDDGKDGDDGDDRDDRGTSASGAAPDEVVEGLIDAAEDGDCDKAKSFLTDTARAADPCSSAEFRLLSGDDVDAEVGDPRIDGTEATVPVRFDNRGSVEDYVFDLEQVDGKWLVASYAIDHDATAEPSADATDGSTDGSTDGPTGGSTDAPAPGGTSTADAVANDPKAVTEAFMASFVKGDCATAEDLVTEAYIAEEGRCDPAQVTPFASELSYEVGTPDVDEAAGTATVPVDLIIAGTTEKGVFALVKQDGLWRINGASD